jgi:DNA-binding MarR family transcriptional regulator
LVNIQQVTATTNAENAKRGAQTSDNVACPRSGAEKQGQALQCVEVLGNLAALFEERRRQLAESVGLTVQQWEVLEQVQHEHFMPSLFAQKRASSAAAVSKILRQLTDKSLIIAHVSDKDARQRDYEVTKIGQELLGLVREQRRHAIDEVWLKLSHEQLDQFYEVGGELVSRLDSFAAQTRATQYKE